MDSDWQSKNYVLQSKALGTKYGFFVPKYIIGDENDVFMAGYNDVARGTAKIYPYAHKAENHFCIAVLNAHNLSITSVYTIYEKHCYISFFSLDKDYFVAIVYDSELVNSFFVSKIFKNTIIYRLWSKVHFGQFLLLLHLSFGLKDCYRWPRLQHYFKKYGTLELCEDRREVRDSVTKCHM